MASINRPELRFAYRVFITVNILLAVYNMICFQLPRNDIKPCVLVIANLSQQDADSDPKVPPLQSVAATSLVKPQFQNRQPLQSKQSTARPVPTKNAASLPVSVTAVAGGGKFVIHGDFIAADESVPFNESVTLTTQATHEFLQQRSDTVQSLAGPRVSGRLLAGYRLRDRPQQDRVPAAVWRSLRSRQHDVAHCVRPRTSAGSLAERDGLLGLLERVVLLGRHDEGVRRVP
uniref:Uncharacterized protein n=1 Tax=Ixodes ricinus TaxID=34613 RepID=V5HBJ2_IXORI